MKNIAVVGATGMVGSAFIEVLTEKNLNIGELYFYASQKSAGKILKCMGREIVVEELCPQNIKNKHIDFALFSAGGSTSGEYAPIFAAQGCTVIDNSSFWRMDAAVPLVVPQVNATAAQNPPKNIIANPNCSTIQSVLPLCVLRDNFGLKSVRFTTFQAVSGSGVKGVRDLELTSKGEAPQNYPHPIFDNCLPHIDSFDLQTGYTKEEMKMVNETRKILELPTLPVTATCVRVPVSNSHSVEIHAELASDFDISDIKKAMSQKEGITLLDDVANNIYPLARLATGQDSVLVGRIRRDISNPSCVHIWCVADNIRKGAASNAIEILELFLL